MISEILLIQQQISEIPPLALIAEGTALLVYTYLTMNLASKWKSTRKNATRNLFLSFAFYFLAVLMLFSTKTTNFLTGDQIDISTVGINIGYAFSLLGNVFLYYFTEDIFFDEDTKITNLREVITLANGITLGFLMIFIFQLQSAPFLELPGEYISIHLLIWHVIVSTVGFLILLVKAFQATINSNTRLARGGFFMISLTAVFEILVFVFFFLDRFSPEGYTYWYFIAWLTASIAGLSSMIGYLMPNWFKRLLGGN
ncbi:hypothetical protein CEE45_16770 [Candidatus Heimdallarchaeota archaeon B3_Heim]|nr:MAG: hypothetical protein CEE45_16770 [Candidatus Heimdallarchaeota archaeon B3_Heim]